jgi:hypothetical protein
MTFFNKNVGEQQKDCTTDVVNTLKFLKNKVIVTHQNTSV